MNQPTRGNTSKRTDNRDSDGNTKESREIRSRAWCLTWNNPTLTQFEFQELLQSRGFEKGVFQLETGDNGTPHYQGTIYSDEAKSNRFMKQICQAIHWEPCKNWRAAVNYCIKVDRETEPTVWGMQLRIQPKINIITTEQLYEWQKQILEKFQNQNDRQILWAWEPNGSVGKTTLAKYIWKHFPNTIYVSGGAKDIKAAIVLHKEKTNQYVENVIFYYTRSQDERVSYQAIEECKDGFFFSGKYESAMYAGPTIRILVFSNFGPEIELLSADRWDIVEVQK